MVRTSTPHPYLKISFILISIAVIILALYLLIPQPLAKTLIASKQISSIETLKPFLDARYSNYYKTDTVDLPSFQITLVQTKYPTCGDPQLDLPKDWNFNKPRGKSLLIIFNKKSRFIEALYEFTDQNPSISTEHIGIYNVLHISGIQTACGSGRSLGYGGIYEMNGRLYFFNPLQYGFVTTLSEQWVGSFFTVGENGYYIKPKPAEYNPDSLKVTNTPTPKPTWQPIEIYDTNSNAVKKNILNPQSNWPTYKDTVNGYLFTFPKKYTLKKFNCDISEEYGSDKKTCATALAIRIIDDRYTPIIELHIAPGISSFHEYGQLTDTFYDSTKKTWRYIGTAEHSSVGQTQPNVDLKPWGYTQSGNEIIKSEASGSGGGSTLYIISDYRHDQVAVFSVPIKSRRLRCDDPTGTRPQSETDACYQYVNKVGSQYKDGDWISEKYVNNLYLDAPRMIKSFRFINLN